MQKEKRVTKKSGLPEKDCIVVPAPETLESIRTKLWLALPTIQSQLEELSVNGPPDANSVQPSIPGGISDYTNHVVGDAPPEGAIPFSDTVIPWDEMRRVVHCLYLVTHSNPVIADVSKAVTEIIGTTEAPSQTEYRWADLCEFLDRIPQMWLPQYKLPFVATRRDAAIKDLNRALIACAIYDDPPNYLQNPDKVLMLDSVVAAPTLLETPVDHFISFAVPPAHPAIYEFLMKQLCDGSVEGEISRSAFNLFFGWFYGLCFSNATALRAEAAATHVWSDCLDGRGHMSMPFFQKACRTMCRLYAQRADDVVFLEQLLRATRAALGESVTGAPLFASPSTVVDGIPPRRELEDPTQLYLPDDLRVWVREEIHNLDHLSGNRIVLHGKRCVGKTTVGKALAKALNCVHLDVEELALDAVRHASSDSLGADLKDLLENGHSISLSLQGALLRRAVQSGQTAYSGYVLSDMPYWYSSNEDEVMQFVEETGITNELQPLIFVELSCEEHVHAERVREIESQRVEALLNLQRVEVAQAEEMQRAAELEAKSAAYDSALHRLAVLKEKGNATDEELEETELYVEESREALDALRALGEVKGGASFSVGRTGGDATVTHPAHEGSFQALRLQQLIAKGREVTASHCESEEEKQWTSLRCVSPLVEVAMSQHRVLRVEGTSPVDELTGYVINALGLHPRHQAEELLPEEGLLFTEDVAGDEELGAWKEKAALQAGCELSHVWKRYCPVTFADDKVLFEGSARYSCTFRSRIYFMASSAKMKRFMETPLDYLCRNPVLRQPLLLLSHVKRAGTESQNDDALSRANTVADGLSTALDLTRMSVKEYLSCWQKHWSLKEERNAVLARRQAYNVQELKDREVRLQKRLALAAKLKKASRKKTSSEAANNDRTLTGNDGPSLISPPEPLTEGAAPTSPRLEDLLQERLDQLKLDNRYQPPVLVCMMDEEDETEFDAFSALFVARVPPASVVVLDNLPEMQRPDLHQQASRGDNEDVATANLEHATVSVAARVLEMLEGSGHTSQSGQGGQQSSNISIRHVNLATMSVQEAVGEVVQHMNPAVAVATDAFVDEDLGQDEDEDEEDDPVPDEDVAAFHTASPRLDSLLKPRKRFLHQFGCRLQYCPVTLVHNGILVRGRNDLCLSYLGELYCFASETYREMFRRHPLRYVQRPAPDIPPRIWLTGETHAGKSTLANGLQDYYGLLSFKYERAFFEQCIEAALTPGGGTVGGIVIPEQSRESVYLTRAAQLLKEVRDLAREEEQCLMLRAEAERTMQEREAREEAFGNGSSDEVDEEAEERLRVNLEYEPEDEEDKKARLNEAYLRIASCVTRIEPFESKGYVMICSPFEEDDLDVLVQEGGIPEVVVNVEMTAEVAAARNQIKQEERDGVALAARAVYLDERRRAQVERRREREVRKWRRRHIGENDPPSASDSEDAELNESEMARTGSVDIEMVNFEQRRAAELSAIEDFLEGVAGRLIDIVKVRGDIALNAMLRAASEALASRLRNRLSLYYSAQVMDYDQALSLVKSGSLDLSSFNDEDPVYLFERRHKMRRQCLWKPNGLAVSPEECGDEEGVLDATLISDVGGAPDEESLTQQEDNDSAAVAEDEEDELSEYDSDDLEELQERHDRKLRKLRKATAPRVAVLCRLVFFFKDDRGLKKFLANPLFYVRQRPPLPRLRDRPLISIFDGSLLFPSEGNGVKRRCLAESIAHNLNYVFISTPKLLSWAALQPFLGSLSTRAMRAAIDGVVADDLLYRLLVVRLNTAEVKASGAVLLNLPRSVEQFDALVLDGAPPIVRAASLLKPHDSLDSGMSAWVEPLLRHMNAHAMVELPVSRPGAPFADSNLMEMVWHIDDMEDHERDALLRRWSGFPIRLVNGYYRRRYMEEHLSQYAWFCPYSWVEKDDLVSARDGISAEFLDRCYVFSEEQYMERFLVRPEVVAHPDNVKALPTMLPERVPPEEVPGTVLALQGCCPVLLYCTREQRGLRGVIEPVAKEGSVLCVVRYDGKLYALQDEASVTLFMKRPWQYVAGALLPHPLKCPLLPSQKEVAMDDEMYMRRLLYDSVAHAMVAVANARPKYPGLSVEESALKYMALHMKSSHPFYSPIQSTHYRDNFALFETRCTFYRTFTGTAERLSEAEYDALCNAYDQLESGEKHVETLNHLPYSSALDGPK